MQEAVKTWFRMYRSQQWCAYYFTFLQKLGIICYLTLKQNYKCKCHIKLIRSQCDAPVSSWLSSADGYHCCNSATTQCNNSISVWLTRLCHQYRPYTCACCCQGSYKTATYSRLKPHSKLCWREFHPASHQPKCLAGVSSSSLPCIHTVCLWHSRCLGSNVIVFSALLVQLRMNIILCLIVRHIVPSGTDSHTYFGAQPPHCLPFLLYMIPKS